MRYGKVQPLSESATAPPLAAATPETRAPDAKAAAPSRRARLLSAALGALLLCGGAWLLWGFAKDPTGELSWLPGTWKGAPLILGACFGGVYGALLLLLRRFTLRGMLLCSVLSAALAGGLTAYVQTITDTQTIRGNVCVPREFQEAVQRDATKKITPARIARFLDELREAGKFNGVQDFQSVTIALIPDPSDDWIGYRTSFEFCPFVQPRSSQARTIAGKYIEALLNLYCLEARRKEWDREDYEPSPLYLRMQESAALNASEALSLLRKEPAEGNFEFPADEALYLIPQTPDPALDPYRGFQDAERWDQDPFLISDFSLRIHWFEQHEEDPVIRDCIRDYTKAVMRYLQSLANKEAVRKQARHSE